MRATVGLSFLIFCLAVLPDVTMARGFNIRVGPLRVGTDGIRVTPPKSPGDLLGVGVETPVGSVDTGNAINEITTHAEGERTKAARAEAAQAEAELSAEQAVLESHLVSLQSEEESLARLKEEHELYRESQREKMTTVVALFEALRTAQLQTKTSVQTVSDLHGQYETSSDELGQELKKFQKEALGLELKLFETETRVALKLTGLAASDQFASSSEFGEVYALLERTAVVTEETLESELTELYSQAADGVESYESFKGLQEQRDFRNQIGWVGQLVDESLMRSSSLLEDSQNLVSELQ